MKLEQKMWTTEHNWQTIKSSLDGSEPQLVFVFGGRIQVTTPEHLDTIHEWYPNANIVLCSTAGEITDTMVRDNSLSLCAVHFEKTHLSFEEGVVQKDDDGKKIGAELAERLEKDGLRHVLLFSDGLKVNGTSLVEGILKNIPNTVTVTGGLVGDGPDFKETVVGLNGMPKSGNVVLIGLYGSDIKIGYGSLGGWDSFGPDRLVTKSEKNVLYELDNRPALNLYKQYLGDQAANLPSSGLLFPLKLQLGKGDESAEVVRTLLSVDEENQSMTFAGDIPEGYKVTLMKANFEKLVDGAAGAAEMSKSSLDNTAPEFALLVSCIGRKLVLKERIEAETEAVKEKLGGGDATYITGFYSYGEISPITPTEKQCRLHNQTMTITTFKEN